MSVDCVILQFTSDTDNIIIVSLMSPQLALAQPFAHALNFYLFPLPDAPLACLCPLYHGDRSTISWVDAPVRHRLLVGSCSLITGHIALCLDLVGVFIFQKVLLFSPSSSVSGVSTANVTQASDSHACDLTPLAANVFSGAELAWFRGWKFQSPLYHFPYHYSIHRHFSHHPESREGAEWLKGGHRALCPTLIKVE